MKYWGGVKLQLRKSHNNVSRFYLKEKIDKFAKEKCILIHSQTNLYRKP